MKDIYACLLSTQTSSLLRAPLLTMRANVGQNQPLGPSLDRLMSLFTMESLADASLQVTLIKENSPILRLHMLPRQRYHITINNNVNSQYRTLTL